MTTKEPLLPCVHNPRVECIHRGLCEFCRVPPAYGVTFRYDSKGKLVGTQEWFRRADRDSIVATLDSQIKKLEEYKLMILKIPIKET